MIRVNPLVIGLGCMVVGGQRRFEIGPFFNFVIAFAVVGRRYVIGVMNIL